MSIILKGIDLPKDIGDIISINLYDKKDNWLDNIEVDRKDIIEIPTPHGRLIDGDNILIAMGDRKKSLIEAFNLHHILEAEE